MVGFSGPTLPPANPRGILPRAAHGEAMKRSALVILAAATTLSTGCPAPPSDPEPFPIREEWVAVVNQPFNWNSPDDGISELTIGGRKNSDDNFANRGDVTVRYEDTGGRIIVEMRRFTQQATQELADADFEKLQLWAYSTSSNPKKPQDMDPEDNCIDPDGMRPWKDGCEIRVYFDGQTQIERAGADLRVVLPLEYNREIEVITEDSIGDSDYQNRGNVCVQNLNGSADITLGSGQAFVTLSDQLSIAPNCEPAALQECIDNNWDQDLCGCEEFAFVKVQSEDVSAADITIDFPTQNPPLWANVTVRNQGSGTNKQEAGNTDPGGACDATVEPGQGLYVVSNQIGGEANRDPWRNEGSLNLPPNAVAGAGYGITAISDSCQVVAATEDPAAFVGKGNAEEQVVTERGNLVVCAGCLGETSCEELLP